MKISSYITTAHGRDRAIRATRDSHWGKWGAILLALITSGTAIVLQQLQHKNTMQEMREQERLNQNDHAAQKAINAITVGADMATVISDVATNQTKGIK